MSIANNFHLLVSQSQNQSEDAETPRSDLTTIDALESARILATNPQTRVTDRIGAAADVCMGTCMATGAIGGRPIGALAAGPLGAERGFTIGFAAGTIAGEFICDPRFWTDAAADSRGGSIPDAGAPDAAYRTEALENRMQRKLHPDRAMTNRSVATPFPTEAANRTLETRTPPAMPASTALDRDSGRPEQWFEHRPNRQQQFNLWRG